MARRNDADATTRMARIVDLIGSGCTEVQARAIADSVDAAAGEAVEALRHELARWHAYLAMYLLAEIGIVLLAALLTAAVAPQNVPDAHAYRRPRSLACDPLVSFEDGSSEGSFSDSKSFCGPSKTP